MGWGLPCNVACFARVSVQYGSLELNKRHKIEKKRGDLLNFSEFFLVCDEICVCCYYTNKISNFHRFKKTKKIVGFLVWN